MCHLETCKWRAECDESQWVKPGHRLTKDDWVRVKDLRAIQQTLDSDGKTDGLPFMPEMMSYCGKTFRIRTFADKVCSGGFRRLEHVCHLEGARCSGMAHGGCQAGCLLYWHESWLEPIFGPALEHENTTLAGSEIRSQSTFDPSSQTYTCQLTEARQLGTKIPAPTLCDYCRQFWTGKLNHSQAKFLARWLVDRTLLEIYKNARWISKDIQMRSPEFRPGDLVRVRTRAEILRTINRSGKHRGLNVTADMLRYCGKYFRVQCRVTRIIDEFSGQLKELKNDCYVLDGVTCGGGRMLCTREEMHYWRGIWLEKAESNDLNRVSATAARN